MFKIKMLKIGKKNITKEVELNKAKEPFSCILAANSACDVDTIIILILCKKIGRIIYQTYKRINGAICKPKSYNTIYSLFFFLLCLIEWELQTIRLHRINIVLPDNCRCIWRGFNPKMEKSSDICYGSFLSIMIKLISWQRIAFTWNT